MRGSAHFWEVGEKIEQKDIDILYANIPLEVQEQEDYLKKMETEQIIKKGADDFNAQFEYISLDLQEKIQDYINKGPNRIVQILGTPIFRGKPLIIRKDSTALLLNNTEICGNTDDTGLVLDRVNRNYVSGGKIIDNSCGIYLRKSLDNVIIGTSLNENHIGGIELEGSSSNLLVGNLIKDTKFKGGPYHKIKGRGMRLINSSENVIVQNKILDTDGTGIYLNNSSNNEIEDSNIYGGGEWGVFIDENSEKNWLNNLKIAGWYQEGIIRCDGKKNRINITVPHLGYCDIGSDCDNTITLVKDVKIGWLYRKIKSLNFNPKFPGI